MAFTCGFYNGPNRMYNAEQLSSIFDGIISDGMYSNYRNSMIVIESENDNEVIVQPGRAWLMHTWSLVDANLPVEAPQSEVVIDRIDALVIDVNTNPEVKNNEITWVQGTPASKNPKRPALLNEEFHKQYPLCYVYRAAGTTSIVQENITNAVGTSEFPFVTGIIDTINTDQLILKWEAQWETFMKTYTSEAETWIDTQEGSFLTWSTAQRTAFETWFESIRGILDKDAAGHIMNIIDARIPAYNSENPAQQITAVRSRKGNYISELRVYANAKPRLFQSADGGQTWEDSSVGGFEPVEISYEDYLALTDEEKDAGDWYVVGMPPMGLNAKTIPYSGNVKNAKNVEDAIDEVNQNLTLNYALSNLPQNTDINTFLQMVLEKLYPARNYVFDGAWKYTTNASTPTRVQCSNVGGFTVSNNMVFMTPPSAGATCKGTRVNSIQNNGKKIYVEGLVNGRVQNYELDATRFSSCNMYLVSMKMQGGSTASGIALTDSATVKTTYELITEFPISTSVSSSGYNITAIYIGE